MLNEIGKLDLSDTRYVMLDAITSKDTNESEFAFKKLTENQDDELLEDLIEIKENIRPEIRAKLSDFFKRNNSDLHNLFEIKK